MSEPRERETGWVVVNNHGKELERTIARTRSEAVDKYCDPGGTHFHARAVGCGLKHEWRSARRMGYRVLRRSPQGGRKERGQDGM